jgi:hypothetical protein
MRAICGFPPSLPKHHRNITSSRGLFERLGLLCPPCQGAFPQLDNDRPYVGCREVLIMSSRRFVPCAALVLSLFGLGGQLFHTENAATWVFIAGFYITAAFVIVALRNRIAAWWSSSTLLPCGCAALLLFAGVNALSRVDWRHSAPFYTNSSTTIPRTTPAPINSQSYRRGAI